ncbi:ankyrin repeat domain-containing protein [uncultured Aquimarina sp.]|uniref:ankyrin repeat domain-containing protein n=1 Tax=uncultured Aquimarina sp. TaxID=575652 RepID=UPI00262A41F0|nr:ankyrin repeat domain-containing protein [uncultured Aquimarina sp.]
MISIDELAEFIYQKKEREFFTEIEDKEINIYEFDQSNYSLLHVAAKVENSEAIIIKLIELGLDIDIKNSDGNTPLIVASNYNCPNNMQTLLKYRADTTIYNNDLNSALHITCSWNRLELTKILIEKGADVNIDAGNKRTPIINAIEAEADIDLIEFLLDNNADVNYGSGNGTPLMFAISGRNLMLIKYLLKRGAKIKSFTNRSGENTLEFAKRVGDEEIVNYLMECAAKE